jgi:hypothetical protein
MSLEVYIIRSGEIMTTLMPYSRIHKKSNLFSFSKCPLGTIEWLGIPLNDAIYELPKETLGNINDVIISLDVKNNRSRLTYLYMSYLLCYKWNHFMDYDLDGPTQISVKD